MTLKVRRLPEIFQPPQRELEEGSIDLALGFYPEWPALGTGLFARLVGRETHVCLVRRGHPEIGARLSLPQYAAVGHVGIFYRAEGAGIIDTLWAKRGLSRRLVVEAPHFLSVPYLVAETNLIATVPEGLARLSTHLPLRALKPPLDLPPFPVTLLWTERTNSDPALSWMRDCVAGLMAGGRSRAARGSPRNR